MSQRRSTRLALSALTLCLFGTSCAARQTTASRAPAAPDLAPAPVVLAPTVEAARTPAAGTPPRTIVLIGDSTTYGSPPPKQGIQSPYNPGAALEALLATLEPLPEEGGTAWRDARVFNLAVAASTTTLWLQRPPIGCNSVLTVFPVVKRACAAQVSWVEAIPLAVEGGRIDAVIIDLGINDLLITKNPVETVDRLETIRDALGPVPVLFYPPIAPRDGPRGDWPERVRAEMVARGLFAEPQYPPYLPTWDKLHPTHGGYAAMGALWLDGLRKLP